MAKVVEVQFVVSHLVASAAPVFVEGRRREQATTLGREQERVCVITETLEVPGERVEDEPGERDHAAAGLGLGLSQQTAPAVEAHHLLFDSDRACGQVEVAAPKRGEPPRRRPPKPARRTIAAKSRGHRVRQFENQLWSNYRAFYGALHPGASHPAGIGLDETVGHGGREDRPQ